MAVQNSYPLYMNQAFEGDKANQVPADVISKTIEISDIPFARAVCRGTGDDQVRFPFAENESMIGITLRPGTGAVKNGELKYDQKTSASIMEKGYILVRPETNVKPGDQVFYRFDGTEATFGRLRNDADNGTAALFPGASFETTAVAEELAVVKLTGSASSVVPAVGWAANSDLKISEVQTEGNISIDSITTIYNPSTSGLNVNMPLGFAGQLKIITLHTDATENLAISIVLQGHNNVKTLTLNSPGDSVTLFSLNSSTESLGWVLLSMHGTVLT